VRFHCEEKISTVLEKTLSYSIGSAFINYKQSIFRQNTNQSNDSTFTKLVEKHQHMLLLIVAV
jgi:hypothetical protein